MKTKQIIVMLVSFVSFVLVLTLFAAGVILQNKDTDESEKVSAEEKQFDFYDDASEQIVLKSVPSEIWHQNVFLLAVKITWMDYENFVIQVGDMDK